MATDKTIPARSSAPYAGLAVPQIVLELNALCKATTLEFALSVGAVVIRHACGGDIARFRSRKPKDDAALRRVANHPDLAMSASMLYGCVATYELSERIGIRSCRHISTSHIRLVLPLTHESQVQLLHSAEANRWSVRRLEIEVEGLKDERKRRGGRRRPSPLARTLRALDRDLSGFTKALEATQCDPQALCKAAEVLHRILSNCRECERVLKEHTDRETDASTSQLQGNL